MHARDAQQALAVADAVVVPRLQHARVEPVVRVRALIESVQGIVITLGQTHDVVRDDRRQFAAIGEHHLEERAVVLELPVGAQLVRHAGADVGVEARRKARTQPFDELFDRAFVVATERQQHRRRRRRVQERESP